MDNIKVLQTKISENHLDIYIVSKTDPHISEYAEKYYAEQLKFLSGFTGSNGLMLVTKDEAIFWTDGRYYTQGKMELAETDIKFNPPLTSSVGEFIAKFIDDYKNSNKDNKDNKDKIKIGIDGRTFSVSMIKNLEKDVKNPFEIIDIDLLSTIWKDRPIYKSEEVFELSFNLTGKYRIDKIKSLKTQLEDDKIDTYLLSSLDDIAWLLNLRGDDIAYSPVFTSFLTVEKDKVNLYTNNTQKFSKVLDKLKEDNINLLEEKALDEFLENLKDKTIALDISKTAFAYYNKINKSCIIKEVDVDYTTKDKAIKNEHEIKGTIIANEFFGTALAKTLYFVEKFLNDDNFKQNNIETAKKYNDNGDLTEYSIGLVLDDIAKENKKYFSPSFPAICGYNENGAIIHYSATKENCKTLENRGTLLLDCGGHYLDGTIDITRTFCLGNAKDLSSEFKKHFTLVLKGHIAIALAIFPSGTPGHNLDILARTPIWNELLDFNHGTGHGLSHFLNVHEGPQGISQKAGTKYPLYEGMYLTNEPGLYFPGKYGIRLENDIIITKHTKNEFNDFLKFDTVSLCYLDIDCMEISILTDSEKTWINNYHKLVFEKLSPNLEEDIKMWLKEKTREI